MELIWSVILAFGIPTGIFSLVLWFLKRSVEKRDKEKELREKNIEAFMTIIARNSRATNILATATAKAVQRIPDAKCNGDMTKALDEAATIQAEEKKFLMEHGIQHIIES